MFFFASVQESSKFSSMVNYAGPNRLLTNRFRIQQVLQVVAILGIRGGEVGERKRTVNGRKQIQVVGEKSLQRNREKRGRGIRCWIGELLRRSVVGAVEPFPRTDFQRRATSSWGPRRSRALHSLSVMDRRKLRTSDSMMLLKLMRDLAIRHAARANAAAAWRPSQSVAPPIIEVPDVFGPYGEHSWDPDGDAEFEARVAHRMAVEAQRGKRKRAAVTRQYNIRNPHYHDETEESDDETFYQRTKRSNFVCNPIY